MITKQFLIDNIPGLTMDMLDGTLRAKYKTNTGFRKKLPKGVLNIDDYEGCLRIGRDGNGNLTHQSFKVEDDMFIDLEASLIKKIGI